MKSLVTLLASLVLFTASAFAEGEVSRDDFLKALPEVQDAAQHRAKLIDMWTQALRKAPGSEEDEVKIRTLALPDGARVDFVRWISAEIAIAQCESQSVRSLSFYVKQDGKWTFYRQYKIKQLKK